MDENMNNAMEAAKSATPKSRKGGLITLAVIAGTALVTSIVGVIVAHKTKSNLKELGEALEEEDFIAEEEDETVENEEEEEEE